MTNMCFIFSAHYFFLRIFQSNGLKLDKDLIVSGSVQNV